VKQITINIASPEIYNNCNLVNGGEFYDPVYGYNVPYTNILSGGNFGYQLPGFITISGTPSGYYSPPPLSSTPCPCQNTFVYNINYLDGPYQITFSAANLTDNVFEIIKLNYNLANGYSVDIVKDWISQVKAKEFPVVTTYYPTSAYVTYFNPIITVYRANNCVDIHDIRFNLTQGSVLDYTNLTVVNTQVLDSNGDVLYTLQSDNPNNLYFATVNVS